MIDKNWFTGAEIAKEIEKEFFMGTTHTLPTESQERKDIPLARGCLYYFPAALAAVAEVSKAGNDKHNPGEELHHARGKSMDHADCIIRHQVDAGSIDPEDGLRHSAKVAWRALAQLQEELEAAGAPLARGAKLPEESKPETIVAESYDSRAGRGNGIVSEWRVLGQRVPRPGDYFVRKHYCAGQVGKCTLALFSERTIVEPV